MRSLDHLDPREHIIIRGARVNNLKNISVAIPRNKLVVITGLSGSGKSSLAFDTLYADGQRRYVESLSSYARQFLGRMSKPDVDSISGIAPAIAIEQKVNTANPRSTVGTSTEIYEYLKLLFSRIGETYSPVSGQLVKRHSVSDVVDAILAQPSGSRITIFAPLNGLARHDDLKQRCQILLKQGFTRVMIDGAILRIEDVLEQNNCNYNALHLVVDRLILEHGDEDLKNRLADSVQTAFYESHCSCMVTYDEALTQQALFSNLFEADGIIFEEPTPNFFSFNNPYGACKHCEGFGSVIGIDEDLVIPNKRLTIYEDAIACWRGEKMGEWKKELVMNAYKFDFPVHKPYYELSAEQKELLWTGNRHFKGLNKFFKFIESQNYKVQYRVMMARYRGKTVCPECLGTRLRKDASYVKIDGKSITELVLMPVETLNRFIHGLELSEHQTAIASRILKELCHRLSTLVDVGLGYLTLNRLSSSLSGGESQRINLATSLGSNLVGSMYILDEPSIGLHPRDTQRLIGVLKRLRDLGNTVIVVEHDEDIIREADEVIDIGPLAGQHGGEIVFQGSFPQLEKNSASLTGKYIRGEEKIAIPDHRRSWNESIRVAGARENNLKMIDVAIPLHVLTVVTGVSGSGKTSLIKQILFPALKKIHGGWAEKTGKFDHLEGDIQRIGAVELVDQNPIGRSSRSNPATYIKAFDEIRKLFASQKLAHIRGYKPGYFSFNIAGGRCEVCEGEGVQKIEMQFMADIYLTCDACNGKRFKQEVLDITYRNKTIVDILEMTIDEAILFFDHDGKATNAEKRVLARLQPLQDVGLGYLKMGQSSSTLSGGEAQRIKLAYFLAKGKHEKPTLFFFDEPTTGLHFHDIHKLLVSFNALIRIGHTVVVVEHNTEVIKSADWIIDLGKEGGEKGGNVVFEGTPENLARNPDSYTGQFLSKKL